MPAQRFDQVLPPAAVARLSEINASGTWASALSSEEFAAIKSVGFEPVGQVLGAAVYNIGFPGGENCPTYSSGVYGRSPRYDRPVYTAVSSGGRISAYAPLVNSLYEARRRAIGRMSAECAALGGHGVVGVSLGIGPFPGGAVEFKAIGTAVRAPGGPRLPAPFTSDVSGQEFAKLIMAGAVPVSLPTGSS
ncbi:MAG TPA: heavy metal-binding domain-containing protein [Streptosporangiaceae bacterium]|nr:heavy metal-binding domain-containing protein [Streptosporangiaceae bacterium]